MESHEVAGYSSHQTKTQPNDVNAVLSSTYKMYSYIAKSTANNTSQSCRNFEPAVCLSKQDGVIWRLSEHLQIKLCDELLAILIPLIGCLWV